MNFRKFRNDNFFIYLVVKKFQSITKRIDSDKHEVKIQKSVTVSLACSRHPIASHDCRKVPQRTNAWIVLHPNRNSQIDPGWPAAWHQ